MSHAIQTTSCPSLPLHMNPFGIKVHTHQQAVIRKTNTAAFIIVSRALRQAAVAGLRISPMQTAKQK